MIYAFDGIILFSQARFLERYYLWYNRVSVLATHTNWKLNILGICSSIVVSLLQLQFFPRGYVVIILMLDIHRNYYVYLGRAKFCRSFGLPKNCWWMGYEIEEKELPVWWPCLFMCSHTKQIGSIRRDLHLSKVDSRK